MFSRLLEVVVTHRGEADPRLSATEVDQLTRWHGWGAAPQVFDKAEFAEERARLADLLSEAEYAAAARTTLNAHYTDPELVAAMWEAVEAAGVTHGAFVEPGCGRGTVLDLAPSGMVGLGVELDPTTARVAELLAHPRHRVVNEDFARLSIQPGAAAAVVGNVPFGRFALFDPDYNPDRRLSIHDHFIAKAAAALAPGGIGVLITSRYTLDAKSSAGREAIGTAADVLGAVRLPSRAHAQEAGTDVVTDVLVLRGRAPGEAANHAPGIMDEPTEVTHWQGTALAEPMVVSTYFAERPGRVMGNLMATSGPYGPQLRVTPTGNEPPLADLLVEITGGLPRAAAQLGTSAGPEGLVLAPPDTTPIGRIERQPSGLFRRREMEGWVAHDPGKQRTELAALVALRDGAKALVDLEGQPDVADVLIEGRRVELVATYRKYVEDFGPINRVSVNQDTGRRSYPRMGGFRNDPGWPRVAALEVYDEATGVAGPATVLVRRVLHPVVVPTHVDDPADALTLSLQHRGQLDEAFMAQLTGRPADDVLAALGDRVYRDPGLERSVVAEEYLSGHVRAKLSAARQAAEEDPALARNVAALEAVLPRDVTAEDLSGTMGAPWVPVPLVEEYLRSLCPTEGLRRHITVGHVDVTGEWAVSSTSDVRWRMGADHPFGGASFDALSVAAAVLNGRSPLIYRTIDEKRVIDPEATTAAIEKARLLGEAFDQWLLHDDPSRSRTVLAEYNWRFNSYVPRSYAGVTVNPPGLSADFRLRPHQHQAIARVVYSRDSGLAHPVGAGKTAEMIVGAFERRRLGLCQLPCFVVPNHMLLAFAKDIATLYPAAESLVIDNEDVSLTKRALFGARVTSHAWDAVVITHSSFTRWGLSPEASERVAEAKLAELRDELTRLGGDSPAGRTLTKSLQRSLVAGKERLAAAQFQLAQRRDAHEFFFDESGIDLLVVDESHEYKNGAISTKARNLRGVPSGPGSTKAADLEEKVRVLRDRHPDQAVLVTATGTLVTNTVAELWVALRYHRPDLLDELGVSSFDAFRAWCCETTSEMELDPSGTTLRRVERLSRYKNLPELARLMGEVFDIVRDEDLDLPRPEIAGQKREVVLVASHPALRRFMEDEVSARADAIHRGTVRPEDDNMLKLTSDCRLASFDWQAFSGEEVPDEHSPLAVAADRIAELYASHRDRQFQTTTGDRHPRTGAFQLVFSDLGTPDAARTSPYDRLRQLLIDRGVPAAKVAFAHEHDQNQEAKDRFFEACRDGRVAVAISSTAKMGQGTNVQDRLVAIHHLSVPWRPSDVEQREGRGIRQGNQNAQVHLIAYAVERSFATFAWQTLERKAGFIGQLLRADPSGPRVLEVTDQEALRYGEVKALATGDQDFIRVATLEDEIARLERLGRSHASQQAGLAHKERDATTFVGQAQRRRLDLAGPAAQIAAIGDHPWQVRIAGQLYDNQGDAARALAPLLGRAPRPEIIAVPGADVRVNWVPEYDGGGFLRLDLGAGSVTINLERREHSALIGTLRRVTNEIGQIPARYEKAGLDIEDGEAQLARIRASRGEPFAHADELHEARRSLSRLQEVLAERYAASPDDAPSSPAASGSVVAPMAEVVPIETVRRLVGATPNRPISAPSGSPLTPPIPIDRGRSHPDHDLER